jgi:hypothetical protein
MLAVVLKRSPRLLLQIAEDADVFGHAFSIAD